MDNDLRIHRVSVGLLGTNCYLLYRQGRNDCIVIDPGADPGRIRAAAGERRIAAILLTHGHFDHIGAVDALLGDGCELVVHPLDADMLRDPALNASWMVNDTVTCARATRLAGEGELLTYAGVTLRVLHTPGHTPGSVCYEADGCLFSGDTVFAMGYGRTDLPGGSDEEMEASLRRLAPLLRDHTLYGGHGG